MDFLVQHILRRIEQIKRRMFFFYRRARVSPALPGCRMCELDDDSLEILSLTGGTGSLTVKNSMGALGANDWFHGTSNIDLSFKSIWPISPHLQGSYPLVICYIAIY